MRLLLKDVTRARLREADVIEAIDAKHPSFHEQVWGQHSVPAVRPWPAGPYLVKEVRVEVDSEDPTQVRELRGWVKAARGV